MSEHKHIWLFEIYEEHGKTACKFLCSCGSTLEGNEVLNRLNATEMLSPAQASATAASIEAEGLSANELRAYAAALSEEPAQIDAGAKIR